MQGNKNQPVLDEDFLKLVYGELNPEQEVKILTEMILRFNQTAIGRIEAIRMAIETKNSKALRYEAHSLKNIAMNLGAKAFAAVSLDLEKLADHDGILGAEELLNTLQAELKPLLVALSKKEKELLKG